MALSASGTGVSHWHYCQWQTVLYIVLMRLPIVGALFLGLALAQPAPATLLVYYSDQHQDNVVLTDDSAHTLDKSYLFYLDDLYVQSNAPGPLLSPLNLYFNAVTNHHMTTASATGNAWAQGNGYALVAVQGFVFLSAADAGQGAQPLEMWYSAARGDHFLVGTAQNRGNAQGAGYVLQYVDSYVAPSWVVWPNEPPTVPSAIPYPPSKDLVGYNYLSGGNAVPPGIKADTCACSPQLLSRTHARTRPVTTLPKQHTLHTPH